MNVSSEAPGAEEVVVADAAAESAEEEEARARHEDLALQAEEQVDGEATLYRSPAAPSKTVRRRPFDAVSNEAEVFVGEWDDEGVFVYQAYSDDIADWALAHQQFGV